MLFVRSYTLNYFCLPSKLKQLVYSPLTLTMCFHQQGSILCWRFKISNLQVISFENILGPVCLAPPTMTDLKTPKSFLPHSQSQFKPLQVFIIRIGKCSWVSASAYIK